VGVQGVTVPAGSQNPFNGVFPIDEIRSNTEIKYTVEFPPDVGAPRDDSGEIGLKIQALVGHGGTAVIVEGNTVFHCRFGFYHDTGSTRDTTVRKNQWHDVLDGVYLALLGFSSTAQGIRLKSLEWVVWEENERILTIEATTYKEHALQANVDSVTITHVEYPGSSRATTPPTSARSQ
jgi:hypothetical protein